MLAFTEDLVGIPEADRQGRRLPLGFARASGFQPRRRSNRLDVNQYRRLTANGRHIIISDN
jgi:hypothetical protein